MEDLEENKTEKHIENGLDDRDETNGRPDSRPTKSSSLTDEHEATQVDVETITTIMLHLENPAVRARLAEMISEEMNAEQQRQPIWKRFGPWLASASSALIMILAFFIPSVEDQWDRYQARQVIQRHVELGRSFMEDGKYELAAKSFAKGFELSDNKRLDIEEERLKAKVYAVNANPTWGVKNPEGLDESEILYLLQLESDPKQAKDRSATLNAYGTFLASAHRDQEAENALREAINLDPKNAAALISLGNLLRAKNKLKEAEGAYRSSISIDDKDGFAYYNLGLVLSELKRGREAEDTFRKAVQNAPDDTDLLRALAHQLNANGKKAEAEQLLSEATRIETSKPKSQPQTPKFAAE